MGYCSIDIFLGLLKNIIKTDQWCKEHYEEKRKTPDVQFTRAWLTLIILLK